MRRTALLATVPLLLAAAPALAQTAPNIQPSRDVSGTYLITTAHGPQTVTVEYSKAANVVRVTPQDQGAGQSYILYDFGSREATMVMPQMQRYMVQPDLGARAAAVQGGGGDDVTTAQDGTKTVAGYECNIYKVTDTTRGTSSTLCTTDDGVILEMTSSDGTTAEAQSISYGDVPAADVQLPPGYTAFAMPQMPGGMSGMGMGGMPGMPNMPGMSGQTP